MKNDSIANRTRVSSSASHHRVQRSTTLNRKYVKRPEKVTTANSTIQRRADDLRQRQALADKINRENLVTIKSRKSVQPYASPAKATATKTTTTVPVARKVAATPKAAETTTSSIAKQAVQAPFPKFTGTTKPLPKTIEKNLAAPKKVEKTTKVKDSAAKSALRSVATMKSDSSSISAKNAFGAKKLLLAFGCAALVVGIIGYAISTNTPDISVRVAAMQTGIDAAYPTYIPRGYSLSGIVSEDKKITMTFNSGEDSFVLSEEKSSWDNETLETSFVKSTWGNNYTSVREQGITLFISGSDAAWINGGILYKIDASANNLTKKQIKSISTSL